SKVVAAQLVSTQLDADDLLRAVAAAFGVAVKEHDKANLIAQIESFMLSLVAKGRRPLLIVDEAQNLAPQAVEELRMLSNFQLKNRALLQSFLVGQPELRNLMRGPQMQQLRQRVIAAFHLNALDGDETRAYIEHRLRHVGWKGDRHHREPAAPGDPARTAATRAEEEDPLMGSARDTPGVVMCVVGARPNYMKMAPLLRAFRAHPALPRPVLVHTGQHYDPMMNDRLFEDLELPRPDINLEVGSATHAVQTAEVMKRFEPVLDQYQPSCVVVVGDVNSTLACSLVAAKKAVPVAHVEAGLRSFDRAMPEEINRVLTDQIAHLLYPPERSAHANLAREGVPPERVCFVGNVMIDSLLSHLARAVPPEHLTRGERRFGVVTLHRPSNVDSPQALAQSLDIL